MHKELSSGSAFAADGMINTSFPPLKSAERHSVEDKATAIPYRSDIDGLRAVAIVPVVAFHAFPASLPGGFVGVDLFFVISGFLIASIVLREIDDGSFSLLSFYRRRVLRLFPALILVLGATLLMGSVVLLNGEYKQLAKHGFAGAFGFANLSLWTDSGYFDVSSKAKPFLHLWSLGVEEQFYLVLPALLLLCSRSKQAGLRIVTGALLISFMLNGSAWLGVNAHSRFYLPWYRAWELLAGVLLAFAAHRHHQALAALSGNSLARNMAAASGFALIVAALILLDERSFSAVAALIPVAGAVLLIASGSNAWVNRQILSNPVLVYVGLISYPLYLWHWPLFSFFHIVHPDGGVISTLVLTAVSVVLAHLTWAFVERPAKRLARSNPLTPVILVAALICIVSLTVVISYRDGRVGWAAGGGNAGTAFDFPKLTDKACETVFLTTDELSWAKSKDVFTLCSQSALAGAPTVAVIGDSHAHHLFAGLDRYFQSKGQAVVNFSASGCYLFYTYPDTASRCGTVFADLMKKVEAYPSVKTVIFGSYTPMMEGPKPDFVANARATFERLGQQGRHAVYLIDVPDLSFKPFSCVQRPIQFWGNSAQAACFVDRQAYLRRVPDLRKNVAQAVDGLRNVKIFDLASLLCGDTICRVRKDDGTFLYRDDNHLNNYGAEFVAQHFDF